MAAVTVTALIAQARQRADMVNSRFVTDTEVAGYLNARHMELYGLLCRYSLIQDETVHEITATGAAYYALPARYFATYDVYYDQGSNTELVRLPRLSHRTRPRTTGSSQAIGYRITSEGVVLYPAVTSGSYKHYYVKSPLKLVETVSDADTEAASVNYPLGWEEFLAVGAAIDCLAKEETVNQELNKKLSTLERRIADEAAMREASETHVVQNADNDSGFAGRVHDWATKYRRGGGW